MIQMEEEKNEALGGRRKEEEEGNKTWALNAPKALNNKWGSGSEKFHGHRR